ncbi:unnamed protein product [Paramecium sonneborni]|uniref:Uncharacterized protein n=1 Tax=Paramecium sonneborni TaxID=65129 RepID=A0A8S1K1M5_9CILI|nr:unnamed protein product [Paramecium sonneborni]
MKSKLIFLNNERIIFIEQTRDYNLYQIYISEQLFTDNKKSKPILQYQTNSLQNQKKTEISNCFTQLRELLG